MTISQTTRIIKKLANTELDLAGSISTRIDIPKNTLSARVIVTKIQNGSWGGAIPINGDAGPLSPNASINDPGSTTLVASTQLSIDQLDGLNQLVIGPVSGGPGIVRAEVRFTVVDV